MIESDNKLKFIFLMFPGGEKSIARFGMYNEVFERKLKNVVAADYKIWKMEVQEQIDYIQELVTDTYEYILVFVPGTDFDKYSDRRLIDNIKLVDKPPKAIVAVLTDEVGRQAIIKKMTGREYVERYLSRFDAVYSWDLYDVEKYGLVYCEAPLSKFAVNNICSKNKVFFIGRDKGRLGLIKEIARYFEDNGVEYEFLINNNGKTGQESPYEEKGVRIVDYVRYDEVARKIQESSCILGMTAEHVRMIPAAFREAILYNKKLITNCSFLNKIPYYNEKYMKSFDVVEDIDIEWIKKEEAVEYDYKGQYDVRRLFEKIEDDYYMGMLRSLVKVKRETKKNDNMPESIIVDFHPMDLCFKAKQATIFKGLSLQNIVPEGYHAEAIIQRSTGNNNLYYFRTTVEEKGKTVTIQLKNLSETDIIASPSMQIICRINN